MEDNMSKRAFGALESQILFILQSGERMTVKDVHKQLGGEDNYNTVMTVMFRLTEKHLLAREKTGLQYTYWIAEQQPNTFLSRIKDKLFGMKTTMVVSHLLETAEDLSDADLNYIEGLINKIKESKR